MDKNTRPRFSAKNVVAEFDNMNKAVNKRAGRNLLLALAIGLALAVLCALALFFDRHFFVLFAFLFYIALCLEVFFAIKTSQRSFSTKITLLTLILSYITFCTLCVLFLTLQKPGGGWIITLIATVVSVDVAGYVFGRIFGKTKLPMRVSPSKTWEGVVASVISASLTAAILFFFLLGIPLWFGLAGGAAIACFAILGDLIESKFKRILQIKDFSNWLPGHGGLFDRVDSLLLAGAFTLLLYFFYYLH